MKKTFVYWKTKDAKRKAEVKKELHITSVSVNGESEYKGPMDRLEPFLEEGLIVIRMKDEQEIRRKKVCVNSVEGESVYCKKIRLSGRKRKV